MLNLEVSLEQVIHLVRQLPPEGKSAVLLALGIESNSRLDLDEESEDWLAADLGEPLPLYDWGEAGVPVGQPVRYVAGQGVVVEGRLSAET